MSLMAMQMALSLGEGIGSLVVADAQAGLQRAQTSYQNALNDINFMHAYNASEVNRARTRDAFVENDLALQSASLRDRAAAEHAASVAGVAGKSVDIIARDLTGSLAKARFAAKRESTQVMKEISGQQLSADLSRITNRNVQVVPRPSVGAMLLGVGVDAINIYDSHQPEGDRIFGYNGDSAQPLL